MFEGLVHFLRLGRPDLDGLRRLYGHALQLVGLHVTALRNAERVVQDDKLRDAELTQDRIAAFDDALVLHELEKLRDFGFRIDIGILRRDLTLYGYFVVSTRDEFLSRIVAPLYCREHDVVAARHLYPRAEVHELHTAAGRAAGRLRDGCTQLQIVRNDIAHDRIRVVFLPCYGLLILDKTVILPGLVRKARLRLCLEVLVAGALFPVFQIARVGAQKSVCCLMCRLHQPPSQ